MIFKFLGKILLFITGSNKLYRSTDTGKTKLLLNIYKYNAQTLFFGMFENYKFKYGDYILKNIKCILTFIWHIKNIWYNGKTVCVDNKNFKRSLFLRDISICISEKDIKHRVGKFCYCIFLKSVKFKGETLPAMFFDSCLRLEHVVLEDVKYIQADAFRNCISLKTIRIPSTVVKIEQNAFMNCINLENVEFE